MPIQTLHRHPLVQTLRTTFDRWPKASVYVVGGIVRNALLDRPFTDIDVVIGGLPVEPIEEALRAIGRVDRVGRRFGVLKVWLPEGRELDVALPRTDASFGTGRYRDVAIQADPNLPIEDDLRRRDFTINAMAWDVRAERLIDPFGGQDDLARHHLRAVGDPADRFQEDATRILRAVRFAVQLSFQIEPKTADAMRRKLPLLEDPAITAREMIAREFVRAFAADPVRAFELWDRYGLFDRLIPEISAMKHVDQPPEKHAEGDVWIHTRLALAGLAEPAFQSFFDQPPSAFDVIATLFHDIGKPSAKTQAGDGTIRFPDHAAGGAKIAYDVGQRLAFASAGIDPDQLRWVIEHHGDGFNLDRLRPTTVERTFIASPGSQTLRHVIWADEYAGLRPADVQAGRAAHLDAERSTALREVIDQLRRRGYRNADPAPLITGQDVMRELGVRAGPTIGRMLEKVRDAQLAGTLSTRDQAIGFLRQAHAD